MSFTCVGVLTCILASIETELVLELFKVMLAATSCLFQQFLIWVWFMEMES